MEAGDWRSELPSHHRQNVINQIFNAIKQKLPPSSLQGLLPQIQEVAVKVEEKIYTQSKSKVEYAIWIRSRLQTLKIDADKIVSNSPSNSSCFTEMPTDSGTLNSTSDTRHLEAYCEDLRSKYLKELKEMYQKISNVLQQNSFGAQEIKLRLGHAINNLSDPKSKIDVGKLDLLKKTINCTLQRAMPRNPVSSLLHGQFSSSMHPGQQLLQSQSQSHGNVPEPNANSFHLSSITPEHMNQKRTMEEHHAPLHKLKQNFQQHQLEQQFIPRKQEIPQLQQQLWLQGTAHQFPQHSPQTDQQNLLKLHTKVGCSSCSASIPSSTPASPLEPGFSEKLFADSSSFSNAGKIEHQQATDSLEPAMHIVVKAPEMPTLPLPPKSRNPDCVNYNASNATFADSNDAEGPVDRLIKVVKLMSAREFEASVTEIASVVCLTDRMAGSASVCGSKGLVGEDFTRRCNKLRMMKMKRSMFAIPLNIVSLAGMEKSDMESTTISRIKRPRIEVNHDLLEEISKVNKCLIDTVVDISDENTNSTIDGTGGTGGTIVQCSFSAVAVIPKPFAQFSLIQPLQLLVPTNYPNCSPILLDKLPVPVSEENEDLSLKAKTKLSMSLRDLLEPMSVGQIARTWDICVRAVISEYALQNGGGRFSSKYGTWEQCFTDA